MTFSSGEGLLAITGIDVIAGGWDGQAAFLRAVYGGERAIRISPALLEKITAAEGAPPAAALLRRVIRRALSALPEEPLTAICLFSEGCPPGSVDWELQAKAAGISGPAVDLGGEADPIGAGLAQATEWLKTGAARRVVLAGVSLAVELAAELPEAALFCLDKGCADVPEGEAAAALVLEKPGAGKPGFALLAGNENRKSALTLEEALGLNQVEIDCFGTLELDLGQGVVNGSLVEALKRAFPPREGRAPVALGSQTANLGRSAAGSLAGLASACLGLQQRFQAGTPGWTGVKEPQAWGAGLCVNPVSRPWLLGLEPERRYTAVVRQNKAGFFSVLALIEDDTALERPNRALQELGVRLFPLAASTPEELAGMLKLLRIQADKKPDLAALSQKWFEVYQKRPGAALGLMLVSSTPEELVKEIDFAAKGVPDAVARGTDWQTPAGSFFAPKPLGSEGGEVCFVYPGAFNSYISLGRDLFHYFPQIYTWMQPVASDLAGVFCQRYLYPSSLEPLGKFELDTLEGALTEDAVAMMTSGMSFSVAYTHILQEVFKLKASSALGYSLGELSMMFAIGVWGEGDQASQALAASPLFSTELAGPLNAVRQAWGMPALQIGRSEELWANYVLMAAPERVLPALEGEPRVYMTHVNTPRQVVIGGDKEACQRVIQGLKCMSLKAPFSYALHCEAMRSAYQGFYDLNQRPIQHWPAQRLYSAAGYDTFRPEVHDIAHRVGVALTSPLDFVRLVRLAYQDGARIFIEVGAGGNCSKWIDDTLRGQPALTLSINRKGVDDGEALVRALARVASHRLNVDLGPLYG